ncbi:hypothetical protein SpCBS45565_g04738 [Spizellomyces sp. 'palustris']|nr:hypothetical protein SpCBS45565_g04738 [Spizellomyces sp. 'palustris']
MIAAVCDDDDDESLRQPHSLPQIRRHSDAPLPGASSVKLHRLASFPLLVKQPVVPSPAPALTAEPQSPVISSTQTSYHTHLPSIAPNRHPLLRRSHSRSSPLPGTLPIGLGLNLSHPGAQSSLRSAPTLGTVGFWTSGLPSQPLFEHATLSAGQVTSPESPKVASQEQADGAGHVESGSPAEHLVPLAPDEASDKVHRRRSGWDWLKGHPLPHVVANTDDAAGVAAEPHVAEPLIVSGSTEFPPDDSHLRRSPRSPERTEVIAPLNQTPVVSPKSPLEASRIWIPLVGELTDVDMSVANSHCRTPSTSRKRRSGWWDGKQDKDAQIRLIKELVRSTVSTSASGDCDSDRLVDDDAEDVKGTEDETKRESVGSHTDGSGVEADASEVDTDAHPQQPESGRAMRLWKRNSSVAMRAVLTMDGIEEEVKVVPDENKSARRASVTGVAPDEEESDNRAERSRPISPPVSYPAAPPRRPVYSRRRSALKLFGLQSLVQDESLDDATPVTASSTPGRSPAEQQTQSSTPVHTLKHMASLSSLKEAVGVAAAAEQLVGSTLTEERVPSQGTPFPAHMSTAALPQNSIAELVESERQLKTQLSQMQAQLQQLEANAAKYRDAAKCISDAERSCPYSDIPPSVAVKTFAHYCNAHGLEATARSLRNESDNIGRAAREATLNEWLRKKEFGRAIRVVEEVMTSELERRHNVSKHAAPQMYGSENESLIPAFEDLIYVLSKYMCIHLAQTGNTELAAKTVETVLKPRVEKERAGRSKSRGDWFVRDQALLNDLVVRERASDHSTNTADANPYSRFNWDRELDAFWTAARTWRRRTSRRCQSESATDLDETHEGPLFARALGEFFLDADLDWNRDDGENVLDNSTLESFYIGWSKWEQVRSTLERTGIIGNGKTRRGRKDRERLQRRKSQVSSQDSRGSNRSSPGDKSVRSSQNRESGRKKTRAKHQPEVPSSPIIEARSKSSAVIVERIQGSSTSPLPTITHTLPSNHTNGIVSPTSFIAPTRTASLSISPVRSRGQSASMVPKSDSAGKNPRRLSLEPTTKDRRESLCARSDDYDRISSHTTFSFNGDADLPPPPQDPQSADFAQASTCGPVLSQIRAIDVADIPSTGQIIAATAGNHDRTDKKISIWDVRSGTLLTQLDNGTSKPVTCLAFHPDDPSLLVSADMEFDVKLWDWRSGACVRLWRKFHTRIVFKAAIVPGGDNRAATCSGDQSIKLFSLDTTSPTSVSSVHANEPFTSFVFAGNPDDASQQKLVASLSYSIRIYRLRTATLLHTIQLRDLRMNKTPLTALTAHPIHDTYILLSCDNQLRLFNLLTETTVKVYQARDIPNGVRVEGQFSPCGAWVYCGTCDIRGRGRGKEGVESGGGIVIWRVHTGKIEKVPCGSDGTAVSVCKWITAKDASRPGQEAVSRKVLVAAGLDRMVRMFM